MSTTLRPVVLFGYNLPCNTYWKWRDADDHNLSVDAALNLSLGNTKKVKLPRLQILDDGMSGDYCLIGILYAVGDDAEGFPVTALPPTFTMETTLSAALDPGQAVGKGEARLKDKAQRLLLAELLRGHADIHAPQLFVVTHWT